MKYNREWAIEQADLHLLEGIIPFWGHTNKPGKIRKSCLSQWYDCRFEVDGIQYHTTEQYMMAQKALLFQDRETYSKIMSADNPKDYKALGREVQSFDPLVWDDAKYRIVLQGNLAKFSQNPELWRFLDSTYDDVLVEASPYDGIWGVKLGMDDPGINDPSKWMGENMLGFALMEVRDILRLEADFDTAPEDGIVWNTFTDCYIKDGESPEYTHYDTTGFIRKDNHWGLLRPKGEGIVFPPLWDGCEDMHTGYQHGKDRSFDYQSDGHVRISNAAYFVRVRKGDRYGVVDSEGRVITPCKWDWIDDYGNARMGKLWGYVNLITGEETEPQWSVNQDRRPGERVWTAYMEKDWADGFMFANHVTSFEATMELFYQE